MISKTFKNIPFLLIFIFFSLLSILLNHLFSIRFESNDDPAMLLIASGKYSGTPDNHLVFINFIYGSLLNLLYSIYAGIEWYTITFITLNTLSISILAKIILKSSYSVIFKIILLLFLFSIFINYTVCLQFTRTASILAIAGLSVIYNSKYKFVGAIIFVFGFLIRFEPATLTLLISLPLFIPSTRNIKSIFSTRYIKCIFFNKNSRVLIFAILISVFCKTGDYIYYNIDPDWNSYKEYNGIRGLINDNPNASNDDLKLPKSISPVDYELLLSFHINPSAINSNDLKKIHQSIDKTTLSQKIYNIKYLISGFSYRHFLFTISLLTFLFFYQNKLTRRQILLMTLMFFGLLLYISLNASVKPRIFFPASFAIIFFLSFLNKKRVNGFINSMILILISCLSIGLINKSYKFENSTKILQQNIFNKQHEIATKYLKRGNKLMHFGSSYSIDLANPFSISSIYPSQKMYSLGWSTNIPFNKDKFDSFNYYINNYGLLVDSTKAEHVSSLISSSILKQQNIKVYPKIILNEEGLSIIEFKTDSTETNKDNY